LDACGRTGRDAATRTRDEFMFRNTSEWPQVSLGKGRLGRNLPSHEVVTE
jgi:hypothetical protein